MISDFEFLSRLTGHFAASDKLGFSTDQTGQMPKLTWAFDWSTSFEPRHEKTGYLHMRKQRRRSAVR